MTPLFIKQFGKNLRCRSCRAKKTTGKKFCQYHLRIAREKWETWARERKTRGLCTYCHRRSYQGFLRCFAHTLYNRATIKAWIKAHPNHSHEQWEKKKAMYRDQGLCVACKDHRPNAPGRARCTPCLARQRVHNKNSRLARAEAR